VKLEFSIEIERSVEDIYELVGNPENDVKWQDAVVEVHKLTPGPIQTGSRFRHTLRIFGKRMGVDVEFIERQPHSGYVLQCRSVPFDFETRVQLTQLSRRAAHTTRVDTIVEGRSTGAARVAAVVLSRHRSSEIERDLHKLKRLMEAGEL
jgi:Polyketide cyclase / dehydrase and lipid transport